MNHYFITGASSGLGKAMAEICLADGHLVTGISRNQNISHKNFKHIDEDLSCTSVLNNFKFPELNEEFEKIILINNAAQIEPVKYCGRADNKDIINAFTVNLIAPAVLSNTFILTFENYSAEKIIINISSGAANYPVDGWSVYCSSKAALNMFSRTVAMEREKQNIGYKIAAIAPGIVDTQMQTEIRQSQPENFSHVEEFKDYKVNGLLQSPEEAAEKIIYAINHSNTYKDVVFSIKN